jgi:hypothetical protein
MHTRSKEDSYHEKQKVINERLRDLDKMHQQDFEEKMIQNEKKKIYRDLLDDQVKVRFPNEYYSPQFTSSQNKFIGEGNTNPILGNNNRQSFLNINPCKINIINLNYRFY